MKLSKAFRYLALFGGARALIELDPDWLYMVLATIAMLVLGVLEIRKGRRDEIQPLRERVAKVEGQLEGHGDRLELLEEAGTVAKLAQLEGTVALLGYRLDQYDAPDDKDEKNVDSPGAGE